MDWCSVTIKAQGTAQTKALLSTCCPIHSEAICLHIHGKGKGKCKFVPAVS